MVISTSLQVKTTDEWERRVGENFRQIRISSGLSQEDVAERASVSVRTLANLESGRGSTLATVIKVAKTLGREDWLDGLYTSYDRPTPLQRLREQRRQPVVRRRAQRRQR